jgi:hypothetical protein
MNYAQGFVCHNIAVGEPSIDSFGVDCHHDLDLSARPMVLCGVSCNHAVLGWHPSTTFALVLRQE